MSGQPGNDEPRQDQDWFWTPEWQDGERDADSQIAPGGLEVFDSMADLVSSLSSLDHPTPDGRAG